MDILFDVISWFKCLVIWLNGLDGFFKDLIIGFVPVFVAVWLSLRIALPIFSREKWWEVRASTYDDIIAAIYHGKRYYEEELGAYNEDDGLNDTLQKALVERMNEEDKIIVEVLTIGPLKVSEEFLERLVRFRQDCAAAGEPKGNDERQARMYNDFLTDRYEAYSSGLKDLVELAKKDLGI